jgi:hypothetical protein
MAKLVHLTPHRNAGRIARSGVAARSTGWFDTAGVYTMPVLSSFLLTHQWVRELRRWHPGVLVAVDVRVPDDEMVLVGHYRRKPVELPASEAVGLVRRATDPRGYEIFVPRAIGAGEVRRVRGVSQGIGWRYWPDAHGARPCVCPVCVQPGLPGAGKLRKRFPESCRASGVPGIRRAGHQACRASG